jgi:phosphopantothenoylcysteine decarboxylase/phosphopantothenate--cysteine ligase
VSANTLAKMATGIADNLLLTTLLSARCPVYFAPAMDLDMYKHPTTTKNVEILESYGYRQIKPTSGELASGLSGCGRMEEPENIVNIIHDFFLASNSLSGKKVMITAGPTYEKIDPVRFIGNHSSGKMGFELAQVMSELGAEVDLISGPTSQSIVSDKVRVVNVVSAKEMYDACVSVFPEADIAIMSAAVADFSPADVPDKKIKKEDGLQSIALKPTIDILSELGKQKMDKQILVGFALETNDEEENATRKLRNKNLDLIVLNSLKNKGAGFGHDTNKVTIITKDGNRFESDLKSKYEIARDIVSQIENHSKE